MTARAPLWLERTLFIAVGVIASFGGVGLLLAFVGHYSLGLVTPFGAAGTVAAAVAALRYRRTEEDGQPSPSARGEHVAAALMCAVAIGTVLWNGANAGNHVTTDRDGGSYAVIATWISDHGSLQEQVDPVWRDSGLPIRAASSAVYPLDNRTMEFQFAHLMPVLYAEAKDLGGESLMFRLPALLSGLALLAIFAVGRRLVRDPWLLLAAVTTLGVGLPQLYIARDTLSETGSQFLLWAGLLGLLAAFDRGTGRGASGVAVLSGVAVGATIATHIDAPAFFLLLPFVAAGAWLTGRPDVRRTLLRRGPLVLAGALPFVVLGVRDLQTRAGGYYGDLHHEVHQLYFAAEALTVLALVVVVLAPRLAALPALDGPRATLVRHRDRIACGVAVVLVLALVLAWTVRPHFTQFGFPENNLIEELQRRENLPIDGTRTFGERTMIWMSWYVGPFLLAFAIIGAALLVRHLIRRPDLPVALVLAVTGALTAVYLYNPQITPDQPWASRRFATASLPLIAIAATVGAGALVRWLAIRTSVAVVLRPVLAAAMVVPVLIYNHPLWSMSPSRGQLDALRLICARLGPDVALLFPDWDLGGADYTQALINTCGVPVASYKTQTSAVDADVHTLAGTWQKQGRTLWVVGKEPKALAGLTTARPPELIIRVPMDRDAEKTLQRRPNKLETNYVVLYGAPVLP